MDEIDKKTGVQLNMFDPKVIEKRKYLYGDYEILDIPQEVIDNRIEILNKRLEEVLSVPYMERDGSLVNKLCDAISFWRSINVK